MPAKPPKIFAFSIVLLTLTLSYFFQENNPPEHPLISPTTRQATAIPIFNPQTGQADALREIVSIPKRISKGDEETPPIERYPIAFPPTIEAPEVSTYLWEFIQEVMNGEAGVIRGVFVPGVLALPVIQQPADNLAFVSEDSGLATQFLSAAKNNVTGLLAHNYLAGIQFYNIEIGQEVIIVMGDGATRYYEVTGIYQFEKLSPNSLRSNLIDLKDGKTLTTNQVFSQFYRGEHKVTFQTCLEREGLANWGLTFIVALPVEMP